VVLEIGPGTGNLTSKLLEVAKKVCEYHIEEDNQKRGRRGEMRRDKKRGERRGKRRGGKGTLLFLSTLIPPIPIPFHSLLCFSSGHSS
jgi:hypothetical protein